MICLSGSVIYLSIYLGLWSICLFGSVYLDLGSVYLDLGFINVLSILDLVSVLLILVSIYLDMWSLRIYALCICLDLWSIWIYDLSIYLDLWSIYLKSVLESENVQWICHHQMGTGYMASFSEDKFWNGAAGDNQLTLFLAVGLGNEMKLKLRLLTLIFCFVLVIQYLMSVSLCTLFHFCHFRSLRWQYN